MREIYLISIKVIRINLYLWSNPTHNYSNYNLLTQNPSPGLAPGMLPASRLHTRHSIGNGWGTSPRHASLTQFSIIYQISIQYRLLMRYQTCVGERIQIPYVRQSYTHYNIRYSNHLIIQYEIHSIAIKKLNVFITLFYKDIIFVKIICMRTHFIHNIPKTHNRQLFCSFTQINTVLLLRRQYKINKRNFVVILNEVKNLHIRFFSDSLIHGEGIISFRIIRVYSCYSWSKQILGDGWKGGDLNYGNTPSITKTG